MKSMLICPVCGGKMMREEHRYVCPKGHVYDRAKSGYVNLLQSQKSSDKRHGDDKLMVKARTDFLEKGYYSPMRDAVISLCQKYAPQNVKVVDVGCGECYYTNALYTALTGQGRNVQVCGVDISKDALISAAKRNKEFELAVASIFKIPVADKGCNVIVNMFAPHDAKEFSRILSGDGIYIRAIPLENHLMKLKEAIYEQPYRNKVLPFELDGFDIVDKIEIKEEIFIDNHTDLENLFMMTPYYYKTGRKEQEKFSQLQQLTTEIEFEIIAYKKKV